MSGFPSITSDRLSMVGIVHAPERMRLREALIAEGLLTAEN
jgi:hypothetical protein